MRSAVVTAIISATALVAAAQSPAPPPPRSPLSAVSGQIVDEESRDPVSNARVSLTGEGLGIPVVLADRDGRFSIDVPPGRYRLSASKSGFAPTFVSAAAGEPVRIPLRRGAVIAGRVEDEYGDPVLGARVVVETPAEVPPDRAFSTAMETDDRGEYRLAALPPESFVVSIVRQRNGDPNRTDSERTVKTFYPGATAAADAERLRLGIGEERTAIDFMVAADLSIAQPFNIATAGPPPRTPAADNGSAASGAIRGQVLATDGRALPFAMVRLVAQKDIGQNYLTRAGGDGRYEFIGLPAGAFRLVASKPGYVPGASGEAVPRAFTANNVGRVIEVGNGDSREGVDLTLARWSTLTGHVLDENGDPVQGASIQMLQVRYERGRRQLVQTDGSNRTTDERGQYRIYAMAPGQYIISAVVGAVFTADLPGYVRSYSPGTPNASEAQIVSIGPSQDVTGIDVMLTRVPTARVAGQMMNALGERSGAGSLKLLPSQRSATVTDVFIGARILADGQFEFPNVPPGQYVIQANRGRPNQWTEGEFAALQVNVNGTDVTDLLVQTSAGSSVTGRVTFEAPDTAKRPATTAIELTPQPADFDLAPAGSLARAKIEADWTFAMGGLNGPRRLQVTRVPAGWALARVLANGIDVTDRPLVFGRDDQSLTDVEFVLTDRVSQVKGFVLDDRSRAAAGTAVVLFSSDSTRWYPASRFLKRAVAGTDGSFALTGLPAGAYHLAVIPRQPPEGANAWQDPDVLDSLIPSSTSVTLGEGQSVSANLKLPAR